MCNVNLHGNSKQSGWRKSAKLDVNYLPSKSGIYLPEAETITTDTIPPPAPFEKTPIKNNYAIQAAWVAGIATVTAAIVNGLFILIVATTTPSSLPSTIVLQQTPPGKTDEQTIDDAFIIKVKAILSNDGLSDDKKIKKLYHIHNTHEASKRLLIKENQPISLNKLNQEKNLAAETEGIGQNLLRYPVTPNKDDRRALYSSGNGVECCEHETHELRINEIKNPNRDEIDPPVFTENFETGEDWSITNGTWEIGNPTLGSVKSIFMGTVLDGNYEDYTNSRLTSPITRLPKTGIDEEIHLRFQQWFSFSNLDIGYIQLSVLDEANGQWSEWVTVSNSIEDTSAAWSPMSVDLTAYADKKVRVGFYHTANRLNCCASESSGWYIDDIQIVVKIPEFGGNFEPGIGDWGSDRGQWQTETGSPTIGPKACATGNQCASIVRSWLEDIPHAALDLITIDIKSILLVYLIIFICVYFSYSKRNDDYDVFIA